MKKERKVIETNGFSDELTLLKAFAILMKDKQGQVADEFYKELKKNLNNK